MPIFDENYFLLIEDFDSISVENPSSRTWVDDVSALIKAHGGTFSTSSTYDTSDKLEKLHINHIISKTLLFSCHGRAVELLIPITTPEWIYDSIRAESRRNYRLYSPSPPPFMDKVVLCIADNLAQSDKEIMYAGVRAFGGQYLDSLTRYTTHLVALDLSNNKSVVAANIRRKENLEIKIVLPHWIDDCIKAQQHVDEGPYLLSDPHVLSSGRPNYSTDSSSLDLHDHGLSIPQATSKLLSGKRIFICNDYNLNEHLSQAVCSLVTSCGGTIVADFDPDDIDIFIGKYRRGHPFNTSCSRKNIDVATLPWLYFVVVNNRFVSPRASSLLHFPVPYEHIPEFKNLRISITGITGDARYYLLSLITIMGGTFTKTLDCKNDFLVSGHNSGEKYTAVKTRWTNVVIVNHLWIEECYASWSYLDPKKVRYSKIDPSVQALGKARLSSQFLGNIGQEVKEQHSNIADSESQDDNESSHSPAPQNIILNNDSLISSVPVQKTSSNPSSSIDLQQSRNSSTEKSVTPPVVEGHRAARSAKARASIKLHSDMEDLNDYNSMAKSTRKMNHYMHQLERSITPSKKKKSEPELPSMEPVGLPPAKKIKNDKTSPIMVAITTGCEHILTLSRSDLSCLSKLGIIILNDYNSQRGIDTIIAPKILRTEKFLKSLSKATNIIHPSYIIDVLNRSSTSNLSASDLDKEFNIRDYSLDKVTPVKQINADLGVTEKKSGLQQLLAKSRKPVFAGSTLNLSVNLNGGTELIASILKEHGLTASKIIKMNSNLRKSNLISTKSGTILVANKAKDKKFLSGLHDVTVVDWEWCVKSIFHGKMQDYANFKI